MTPVINPELKAYASERQAQLLDAINEHGGYRAAARALGIAQSGISQAMVRLQAAAKAAKGPAAPTKVHADTPIPDAVRDVVKAGRRVFVITCAVNATQAHTGFVHALEGYCERNGASLLCIPLRYKNPTSQAEAAKHDGEWWASEICPYLISHRESLTPELILLADIRTQPTASAPLTGFEGLTGGASGVIGHPQIALTTVPTPQHKLPKILATTGACTVAVYSESKAGARGEFNHSLGALVVEIEADNTFHMRQLVATDDGSFEDIDTVYHPDGNEPNGGVSALVMGDSHIDFIDAGVVTATFTGGDSMVHALRPDRLVWHDILDCYSVSHHHERDPITQFAKHHAGRNNVRAEIERVFAFVDTHSPEWCTNVFVASNHIDHLGQWVRSTDPRRDPTNAMIWAELYHALCVHAEMGAGGAKTIDPFVYLAKRQMASANRSVFLGRDQSYAVEGIELSLHGDKGPNGARGARKAFDKVGVRSIVGHSHSPGITGGVYQVGTSSRYDLEYASGPSSWLHTHCIVYRNGKRSLVNIIGDRWRAA